MRRAPRPTRCITANCRGAQHAGSKLSLPRDRRMYRWADHNAEGQGSGADGAGRTGKGAGRGAPAPANLPELHILRDEMRRAWCAGGRNAATTPCQMEAFMAKVKAESDPVKKKALTTAHATEQAEKRNSKVKCPLGGTPARPLRPPVRLSAAGSRRPGREAERLGTNPRPESAASPAPDSTALDDLGTRPTPPGPRPGIPRTSLACSTAPFAENGWPKSMGLGGPVQGDGPMRARCPNAGPMAQCGADGQPGSASRRHRASECPGRRLARPARPIPLGAAGRPIPIRHVFEAGFCAENPTKEHICKNKQLLALSPST